MATAPLYTPSPAAFLTARSACRPSGALILAAVPRSVYLDVNVISNLMGRARKGWTQAGLDDLRSAALRARRDGLVAFIGSHYHIEEASRMPANLRGPFLEFFWDAVAWNLLLPVNELTLAEVGYRAPLEGAAAFDTYQRRQAIRRATSDEQALNLMAADVATFVSSNAVASKARRDEIKGRLAKKFANKKPAQVTREWWEDAEVEIASWVAEYMGTDAARLGLPADRAEWPEPQQMQSAWAITGYLAARAALVVGMSGAVMDGDTYDTFHYASACYADVVVTEDAAFRETMAAIPNNPVTSLTFDQFAAQLGFTPR